MTVLNDVDSLRKLENQYFLVNNLVSVKVKNQRVVELKMKDDRSNILELAPGANHRLENKACNLRKIFRNLMMAIIFANYDLFFKESMPKGERIRGYKAKQVDTILVAV